MIVRRLGFILCIFSYCFNSLHAQFSLQFVGGLMNYGGDLQTTGYAFNQSHPTAGINAIYTIKHVALRVGFNAGSVSAQDKIISRNLNFKSNIVDANLCLEYDFLTTENSNVVPYIFAGIGVFHFNPYTSYKGRKTYLQPLGTEGEGLSMYPNRKIYSLTGFEDPYGIGIRFKVSPYFLIGLEYNARLLFTDYLDDVSTRYPDKAALFAARGQAAVDLSYRGNEMQTFPVDFARGNPKQNDNYYTSVLTLTYIFHKNSSFGTSTNGGSKRSLRALLCPRKVH